MLYKHKDNNGSLRDQTESGAAAVADRSRDQGIGDGLPGAARDTGPVLPGIGLGYSAGDGRYCQVAGHGASQDGHWKVLADQEDQHQSAGQSVQQRVEERDPEYPAGFPGEHPAATAATDREPDDATCGEDGGTVPVDRRVHDETHG